jgi:hypothetical protein
MNWTYEKARDKILIDLDLVDEDFVDQDEMVGYFNEAIREAEAEIHKLGVEDEYFLKPAWVAITQGTSDYDLPTDIYAYKIRRLMYRESATNIYPIRRIRGRAKFEKIVDAELNGSADDYQYYLKNASSTAGMKLVLLPAAKSTLSQAVQIWYIREAQEVPYIAGGSLAATEATIIDIPEFINFIMQYVKVRVLEKEKGPLFEAAITILQQQRKLMVDTLTDMVPDNDDTIDADFSHYGESS